MAPAKSRSQQRLYRHRDIEVILLLKRLLHAGALHHRAPRKRLRELGVARALEVPQVDLGLEIDHLARYRRIREELRSQSRRCSARLPCARSTGAVRRLTNCPVGP